MSMGLSLPKLTEVINIAQPAAHNHAALRQTPNPEVSPQRTAQESHATDRHRLSVEEMDVGAARGPVELCAKACPMIPIELVIAADVNAKHRPCLEEFIACVPFEMSPARTKASASDASVISRSPGKRCKNSKSRLDAR